MKTIRTSKLWFREGSSDKVYIVDLVDTETTAADARFLVNIRYGRRGQTLREGTKTPAPTSRNEAEQIFDSVVVSKVNDGYRRSETARAETALAEPLSTSRQGREQPLLAHLEACLRSPWISPKQDRLFWRIGEIRLRAATPYLTQFVEKTGPASVSYSLVWAIARCGGEDAVAPLQAIARETLNALIRGLADFALISPLMGDMRLPAKAQEQLPAAVADALAKTDIHALHGAMSALAKSDPPRTGAVMVELYRLAQNDPGHHELLAELVRRLPVRPPFIPGLRRLFKYAEMIDDAAIFGATAYRFETARPMYRTDPYQKRQKRPHALITELHPYRWQPLDHLSGDGNPRTALSDSTHNYLKRRIWRAMRKRGETGQESFLELATAYLLNITPDDLAKPEKRHFWRWNSETRRPNTFIRKFSELRDVWAAAQILYRNSPDVQFRSRKLSHFWSGEDAAMDYGRAFPELWDARPGYALRLVRESQCRPIALFGLSVLQQKPDFIRSQDADILAQMLASPFVEIIAFAFEEAKSRLAGGETDDALIAALMEAQLPEARALAVKRIELRDDWPWSSPHLAFLAVTSPHEDVQAASLEWCSGSPLSEDAGRALAASIVHWLTELASEDLTKTEIARLRHLRACLPHLWPHHDLPLGADQLSAFMTSARVEIAATGIALLAISPDDPASLPGTSWDRMLNSPAPEIQSAALNLLGRLSDEDLSTRAPLIASLATAPSSEVRRAAAPLIGRLAARYPRLGDELAARLTHSLFRSAPDDDYAGDTVALLREGLPDQLAAMDLDLVWRLLHARAKGAQMLGWAVLERRDPEDLSVRQLARLGNHPFADVRQWVMRAYAASPTRFQNEAPNAVLLVESEWPDSYQFAIETFERWPEHVWSPDVLAVISDSTNPQVLDFARTILRRTLRPGDASAQLLRLLEHPAPRMHLLITELLTAETAENPAIFEKLLPLSRIILLQVHQGRIAKDRIGSFLHAEALKSEARARDIAPIFADLSLSAIDRDRARAVMAMRDIEDTYPGLSAALPLKRVEPEVRSA